MGYSQAARVGIESLEGRVLLSYPPAVNDDFADAALLQGTQATGSATWYGASLESGEPGSSSLVWPVASIRTLWWKWTAPQDGRVAIDTAGTTHHPGISVYVGDTLETLYSAKWENSGWQAAAGTTYHIQAMLTDMYNPSVHGNTDLTSDDGVQVRLSQTDAEAPTAASFVATAATRDPYKFSAGLFADAFSSTGDQPLTSIVLGRIYKPGGQTSELYYKGVLATPGTEVPIDSISDLVYYPAESGTSQVWFQWCGSDGLRWSGAAVASIWFPFETAPANDDWADRQQISGPEVNLEANTAGATTEPGEPDVKPNGTVWYEWTAPYSGVLTKVGGSQYTSTFYEGDPFAQNPIRATSQVKAGKTYSIAVAASPGSYSVHFLVATQLGFWGTAGDDDIRFTLDGGTLRILINGELSEYPVNLVSSVVLRTGGGNDSVLVDVPLGWSDTFEIFGGAGDDTIVSGGSADTIRGGMGNDSIRGGAGDDVIYGGVGDDLLWGNEGSDDVTGKAGADTVYGGSGSDTLKGGEGSDLLRGGFGTDFIDGEDDSDTIYGGGDNDRIVAGAGDDQVYGLAGNDTLRGGLGVDTIDGGAGDDVLVGTELSLLDGGIGENVLYRTENGE